MLNGQSQTEYMKELRTFDPKQYLFQRGTLVLMERGGLNERQARSWLGKCLKATKDNPYPVMEALQVAQDKAEMVSFMRQAMIARGYVLETPKKRPETPIDDEFLKTLMDMPGMDRATVASYFGTADITIGENEIVIVVPAKWTADRINRNYVEPLRLAARGKQVTVRAR